MNWSFPNNYWFRKCFVDQLIVILTCWWQDNQRDSKWMPFSNYVVDIPFYPYVVGFTADLCGWRCQAFIGIFFMTNGQYDNPYLIHGYPKSGALKTLYPFFSHASRSLLILPTCILLTLAAWLRSNNSVIRILALVVSNWTAGKGTCDNPQNARLCQLSMLYVMLSCVKQR